MADFQFLYPYWLFLIPLWLLLVLALHRFWHAAVDYDSLVDEPLRPAVLTGSDQKHRSLLLPSLLGSVLLLALSGPSFQHERVPVYELQQGLVVVLDLSTSMMAQDVKPSRLQRARFELQDLLKRRMEGQTGLVVFAGDAFSVSPMTTDTETILSQTGYLKPEIMPAQGSRMDRGIEESVELLKNSAYTKGNILLLTDGLYDLPSTIDAAEFAASQGYEVSIMAIGSEEGGIIPLNDNQTMHDKQGNELVAKLDIPALQQVAKAGKGILLPFSISDDDTRILHDRYRIENDFQLNDERELEAPVNNGIWLLLPLAILISMMFRKGYVWVFVVYLTTSTSENVYAFDWDRLWLNSEQMGKKALDLGEPDKAQQLFHNKQWQAVSAYRAGDYDSALQLYEAMDTVDAWYNRGNVYAQMNQPGKAIQAYQEVLSRQPDHQDAQYNLNLLVEIEQEKFIASYESTVRNNMGEPNNNAGTSESGISSARHENQQDDSEGTSTNPVNEPSQEQETTGLAIRDKEARAYKDQWLKSIPDDPSGLWRRKFLYQYKKRGHQSEIEPW